MYAQSPPLSLSLCDLLEKLCEWISRIHHKKAPTTTNATHTRHPYTTSTQRQHCKPTKRKQRRKSHFIISVLLLFHQRCVPGKRTQKENGETARNINQVRVSFDAMPWCVSVVARVHRTQRDNQHTIPFFSFHEWIAFLSTLPRQFIFGNGAIAVYHPPARSFVSCSPYVHRTLHSESFAAAKIGIVARKCCNFSFNHFVRALVGHHFVIATLTHAVPWNHCGDKRIIRINTLIVPLRLITSFRFTTTQVHTQHTLTFTRLPRRGRAICGLGICALRNVCAQIPNSYEGGGRERERGRENESQINAPQRLPVDFFESQLST